MFWFCACSVFYLPAFLFLFHSVDFYRHREVKCIEIHGLCFQPVCWLTSVLAIPLRTFCEGCFIKTARIFSQSVGQSHPRKDVYFFLPSFGSQYLQLIVGERSPTYHLKAQVYVTVLTQSNSFVAAEGEIRAFGVFCLSFKKLKGARVCCNCAINAGKRE